MFTGIVTDVGRVKSVRETNRDRRFEIETGFDLASLDVGASVSHAGCCLTVVEKGEGWFAVEVSGETLALSTLGDWTPGRRVNLERAARLGDELGGHIVSGHVDGVGEAVSSIAEHGSIRWIFRVPPALSRFIAVKGSIAVDGVSLTVNEVTADTFGVNIIPHTASVTGFGTLRPGDGVNIEIDMLARYVARLAEFK
jgi:riboflavin synthase